MNLFQLVVVPFLLLIFLWCAWRCIRGPGRYSRIVNGLLACVWALACVLVLDPALSTAVAEVFGIHRGVDLVLYLFMVLAFFYAMIMYYRLCDLRRDITLIVRHIAIAERQIPGQKDRIASREE